MANGYGEYLQDGYYSDRTAANALPDARMAFIRRTYGIVALAITGFVVLTAVFFKMGFAETLARTLFASKFGWLGIIIAFLVAGYVAKSIARAKHLGVAVQLGGLAIYVVLEAVIITPLMYIAELRFPGQGIPLQAGVLTLLVFGGLTAFVFTTKRDFSWLGPVVMVGFLLMIGAVVLSMIFGFQLGIVIAFVGAGLAAAAVIYDTSNILHHYNTDDHIPAGLELFASIATLYWYILQIVMQYTSNRD